MNTTCICILCVYIYVCMYIYMHVMVTPHGHISKAPLSHMYVLIVCVRVCVWQARFKGALCMSMISDLMHATHVNICRPISSHVHTHVEQYENVSQRMRHMCTFCKPRCFSGIACSYFIMKLTYVHIYISTHIHMYVCGAPSLLQILTSKTTYKWHLNISTVTSQWTHLHISNIIFVYIPDLLDTLASSVACATPNAYT